MMTTHLEFAFFDYLILLLSGVDNVFVMSTVRFFLCLMAYQLFLGYLMPKPFSKKNSSGTI